MATRCAKQGRRLNGCRSCAPKAIEMMMAMVRADLAALNITHDIFFSERSLVEGDVDQVAGDHRLAARARLRLRRPLAAAKGCAGRGLGGSRADAVSLDRVRRRCRPPAEEVRRFLHLFRLRHRLSPQKLDRGFRTLIDVWGADHGGYIKRMQAAVAGAERRQGRSRRQGRPACEAVARRRAGQNVEAGRGVRDPSRGRG